VRLASNQPEGHLFAVLLVVGVVVLIVFLTPGDDEPMPGWLLWGIIVLCVLFPLPMVAKAVRRKITGTTAVEVDDFPLAMGQRTTMRVFQPGPGPIERLTVKLSCCVRREEGLEITNVRDKELYSAVVVDATGLQASRRAPVWEGELAIPTGPGGPSDDGDRYWRTWGLEVSLTMPGKPAIAEVFTLRVVAREGADA
jgi:hypothetical protein